MTLIFFFRRQMQKQLQADNIITNNNTNIINTNNNTNFIDKTTCISDILIENFENFAESQDVVIEYVDEFDEEIVETNESKVRHTDNILENVPGEHT